MTHSERDSAISDLESLTAILKDLTPHGITLYEFRYYPEAFGSLELVVGKGHECVKFTWDGRDSLLSVSHAEATNKDAIVPWTRETDISLRNSEGLFAEIASHSRRMLARK